MSGFSFPIPGLGKTFVVPNFLDVPFTWDSGPGHMSRDKRKKAQAAKKLKKLRRKQGR